MDDAPAAITKGTFFEKSQGRTGATMPQSRTLVSANATKISGCEMPFLEAIDAGLNKPNHGTRAKDIARAFQTPTAQRGFEKDRPLRLCHRAVYLPIGANAPCLPRGRHPVLEPGMTFHFIQRCGWRRAARDNGNLSSSPKRVRLSVHHPRALGDQGNSAMRDNPISATSILKAGRTARYLAPS